MRVPDRGDIWHLDLDPAKGSEQRGARFVFVVSPKAFNTGGLALVCPVTQGGALARYAGFAVTLMGTGTDTQGVVACNHARTIDFRARNAGFKERAPDVVTADVIGRLQTLLD
jgi:mRNA interferase ChpB